MDATARLVVGRDARGRSVPTTMRGEAPLLLRVTQADRPVDLPVVLPVVRPVGRPVVDGRVADHAPLQVHLVGGAAGPLGGDRLDLSIEVGPDAALVMRSVAASLAQPGRAGTAGSRAAIDAVVASGATLDWWPEPLVSVVGSDHTQITRIEVAESATLRWVDEVVLGRHGEPGGRLTMQQRITVAGLPMIHHRVVFDPANAGAGRHGSGRVAVTGVLIGRPAQGSVTVIESDHRVVRYPVSDTCTAWIALADSLDIARRALDALGLGMMCN